MIFAKPLKFIFQVGGQPAACLSVCQIKKIYPDFKFGIISIKRPGWASAVVAPLGMTMTKIVRPHDLFLCDVAQFQYGWIFAFI